MKILRIIARLNVGGPARHVVWLTERLNDEEFESVLIAGTVPKGEESMTYVADQHGVHPVFIEEMSRELSPKDLISLFKVLREVRRLRPDIIHTHTAKAGTVGRSAAFLYKVLTLGRRRVRVVHTFHGHVFHSYYGKLKTRIFITIERLLAKFATDKIIVISPQQFHEIHEQVGIGRREQFEVVPLGIDLETFATSDASRQNFRNEIVWHYYNKLQGNVGRFASNHDVLYTYKKLNNPTYHVIRELRDKPKRQQKRAVHFYDMPFSKTGGGGEFSKWFGRRMRDLGLGRPGLVFHSFRHRFIDELREIGTLSSSSNSHLAVPPLRRGRSGGGQRRPL